MASESFVFDMGVHSHGITPKSMVYELYMKLISWKILVQNRLWLGVPPFQETCISWENLKRLKIEDLSCAIPQTALLLCHWQCLFETRRKITGNMSSDELAISRTLIIAFACFILCCGCGHGIRARKAPCAKKGSSHRSIVPFNRVWPPQHLGSKLLTCSE